MFECYGSRAGTSCLLVITKIERMISNIEMSLTIRIIFHSLSLLCEHYHVIHASLIG